MTEAKKKGRPTNLTPITVKVKDCGVNPIQAELFPNRHSVDSLKDIKFQFTAYFNQYGHYFNSAFPVVVRHGEEGEPKYVLLDGMRRHATAALLGVDEIPALLDEQSKASDDLINLKRIVESDSGYSPLDKQSLFEKMKKEGFSSDVIRREFGYEELRRAAGYEKLPQSIKARVKATPEKYSKAARLAATVYEKPDKSVESRLPDEMPKKLAEAIILTLFNREDLNSQKAVDEARKLKADVIAGNLTVDEEGKLVYAKENFTELSMNPVNATGGVDGTDNGLIKEECDRAVNKRRTKGYGEITANTYFNEALSNIMREAKISEAKIASALSVSGSFINQLKHRISHANAAHRAKLSYLLLSEGIPKPVVEQIRILAYRDATLLHTKRDGIADTYSFRAGKILQECFESKEISIADAANHSTLSPSTISNYLQDKSQPTERTMDNLRRYLQNQSVPKNLIQKWQNATYRDVIFYKVTASEIIPEEVKLEIAKLLDDKWNLDPKKKGVEK
jgi:transcriptional regulator with XRE-family HTH domain